MLTGIIKPLLSAFLIMFLISGGRVCGCEVLSWIRDNVNQSETDGAHASNCHHHHAVDETHRENRCNHSPSDEPDNERHCCQDFLKPIVGDIPRILVLPNLPLDGAELLAPASLTVTPPVSEVSPVKWNRSPGDIRNNTETRLFQQRFNI